jgi:hypothetical protein
MELKGPSPNSRLTSLQTIASSRVGAFPTMSSTEEYLNRGLFKYLLAAAGTLFIRGCTDVRRKLARHQLKITLEFADIWLSKQVGRLSDDRRPYSNHPDVAAYKVFQALHSSHPYFDALITLPATVSSNYKCMDVSAWKLVCTGPDAKSIYIPLSILPRLHFALFALKC